MPKICFNFAPSGLVPPGDYVVEVRRVTLCDKNDGSGQFLRLDLIVVEGAHEGACFDTVITLDPELFAKFGVPMLAALDVQVDGREVDIEYDEELRKRSPFGDEYDRVVTEPDLMCKRAVAEVMHREFGEQTYVRVRRLKAVES